MLLLLHALIPCVAAYILHLFLYFLALLSLHPSTVYWKCFYDRLKGYTCHNAQHILIWMWINTSSIEGGRHALDSSCLSAKYTYM